MASRFLSVGRAGALLALAIAIVTGPAVSAQDGARAVVQPLPPPEAGLLAGALQRLASNPRDLDALITAGKASLKLDDVDAALGFFSRAEAIAPGDPRTKAGMAMAMVKEENPFDALRLFDEAERAGVPLSDVASERALAYDLVGDNARAQALYREVLARGEDAETSRRLAVSLAISGDAAEMERILLPMLQRRDLAAYRTRAFALAIIGKTDEAITIADAVMPKPMAAKIDPYLRDMKRLTPAQQAAAANLGNFPRVADIGHDDPRVAIYAGELGTVAPVQTADARLAPAGKPLGPNNRSTSNAPQVAAVSEPARPSARELEPRAAPAAVAPAPVAAAAPAPPAPTPASPAPTPAPQPTFAETRAAPAAPAAAPSAVPAAQPAPAMTQVAFSVPQAASAPAFDLAQVGGNGAAASTGQFAESRAAPHEARPPVAIAFADFEKALSPATPAAGAVDLSKIEAPRERVVKEEPKPAKPAPPKHPARHWVQVATGKDRARLAFDWRRILRTSNDLLKGSQSYYAQWGQTGRLLTGPFPSEAAAKALVAKLHAAKFDAFTFSSKDGEEVTPLSEK
jgi:hypothetical protein